MAPPRRNCPHHHPPLQVYGLVTVQCRLGGGGSGAPGTSTSQRSGVSPDAAHQSLHCCGVKRPSSGSQRRAVAIRTVLGAPRGSADSQRTTASRTGSVTASSVSSHVTASSSATPHRRRQCGSSNARASPAASGTTRYVVCPPRDRCQPKEPTLQHPPRHAARRRSGVIRDQRSLIVRRSSRRVAGAASAAGSRAFGARTSHSRPRPRRRRLRARAPTRGSPSGPPRFRNLHAPRA